MIELKNISLSRGGKELISHLTFSAESSSISVIVGPNGCGKSSLLEAIAGELPLNSGEITFEGQPIAELDIAERAQLISVVAQNNHYWLAYTVREVISLGQDRSALARVDQVMNDLDLAEIAEQSVLTLSGGQSQRVEIARALVRDTPIYLFDEPFAAQDRSSREKLQRKFLEMKSAGATIIFVAHYGTLESQKAELAWCDHVIDYFEK